MSKNMDTLMKIITSKISTRNQPPENQDSIKAPPDKDVAEGV